MTSTGVAAGHFEGILDETRIWSVARTRAEIAADINDELESGSGLVARWGMGEGAGTTIADSLAMPANGTSWAPDNLGCWCPVRPDT